MVATEVVDEAERRGGIFEGVIGRLDASCPFEGAGNVSSSRRHDEDLDFWANFLRPPISTRGGHITVEDPTVPAERPETLATGTAHDVLHIQPELASNVARHHFGTPYVGRSGDKYAFATAAGDQARKALLREIAENLMDERRRNSMVTSVANFGDWRWHLDGIAYDISEHQVIILRTGPRASPAAARRRHNAIVNACLLLGSVVMGLLPLAVVGGLSRFAPGSRSTVAQRAWTMSWLATGVLMGPLWYFSSTVTSLLYRNPESGFYARVMLLVWAVPAVGGMVSVAQMIWAYGSCVRLGGG
ncbi:hypothetical protein VTK73DRAFT_7183 [Phialemonium thermophilum]|uniref:Uncharacterized protein n=1 Tax=Phialemonium thermophilum TaxID=223376 RepID=A0ABR3WG22_9PEZI